MCFKKNEHISKFCSDSVGMLIIPNRRMLYSLFLHPLFTDLYLWLLKVARKEKQGLSFSGPRWGRDTSVCSTHRCTFYCVQTHTDTTVCCACHATQCTDAEIQLLIKSFSIVIFSQCLQRISESLDPKCNISNYCFYT